MTPEKMEARITALEVTVAEMRQKLNKPAEPDPKPHWLERFRGAFKGDPAFADVVRYGREFRESHPIAGEEPQ